MKLTTECKVCHKWYELSLSNVFHNGTMEFHGLCDCGMPDNGTTVTMELLESGDKDTLKEQNAYWCEMGIELN